MWFNTAYIIHRAVIVESAESIMKKFVFNQMRFIANFYHREDISLMNILKIGGPNSKKFING